MIIPIRCFTCGKVISGKWEAYVKAVRDHEGSRTAEPSHMSLRQSESGAQEGGASEQVPRGKILDSLGVSHLCCRRHFLSNVDLMDVI